MADGTQWQHSGITSLCCQCTSLRRLATLNQTVAFRFAALVEKQNICSHKNIILIATLSC